MIRLVDHPTPAALCALTQATELWPERSRISDGLLPRPEHVAENPMSDHNDGRAFDLTHDPVNGVNCDVLAEGLRAEAKAGRAPRVKYIIRDRRITSRTWGFTEWRPYTGSNPHIKHMHVSIVPELDHDTSPWWRFQEDDMTPEQAKMLADINEKTNKLWNMLSSIGSLTEISKGKRVRHGAGYYLATIARDVRRK